MMNEYLLSRFNVTSIKYKPCRNHEDKNKHIVFNMQRLLKDKYELKKVKAGPGQNRDSYYTSGPPHLSFLYMCSSPPGLTVKQGH